MPPRKKAKKLNPLEAGNVSNATTAGGANATQGGTSVRRNVRGRRGGLKDMPNMPLDVLIEIFAWMHPRDLLALARTSKPFRALLMSQSARPFWKASLECVEGLPKCPTYLSEPAFVNLLFFSHCHNCLRSNVQTAIFEFSARYCSGCKPIVYYRRSDCDSLLEDIWKVSGEMDMFVAIFETNARGGRRWLKSDVDRFQERWDALKDVSAKKALVTEYLEKAKLIAETTQQLRTWKDAQKEKRSAELDDIRVERVNTIKARLCDIGWADEVAAMSHSEKTNLAYQKFASKAELLTDRGWQKIRTEVVSFMQGVKTRRLEAERRAVLRNHFSAFAEAFQAYRSPDTRRSAELDQSPHLLDLAMMSEFRDILDVPEGADLSILDDSDAMRAKFDAASTTWREDCKNQLTAMVRQSLAVPDDISDPLTLAMALFSCDSCGRGNLTYPGVVSHICLRSNIVCSVETYVSTAKTYWHPTTLRSPWSISPVSVSDDGIALMRPILEACGLDPDRATHQDVENCAAQIICTGCSRSTYKTMQDGEWTSYKRYDVHTCKDALVHSLKRRTWAHNAHQWEIITEEESEAVSEIEDEPDLVNWDMCFHGCVYCEFASTLPRMEWHMRRSHDINIDLLNSVEVHSYPYPDAEPQKSQVKLTRHENGKIEVDSIDISLIHNIFPFWGAGDSDEDDYFGDSDLDDF